MLRKKWLHMICRKTSCLHRAFCWWEKTYENNVPGNKPIVFKERKSGNSLGFTEKKKQFNVDESIDMTVENESELSVMKHEKECLKKKLHERDVQMQEQKGTANISKVSS